MSAPPFRGRTRPVETLYEPYSSKARRTMYVYGVSYNLWATLEWDRTVEALNERPPSIDLPLHSGTIGRTTPMAVTRNVDGTVAIHVIARQRELSDADPASGIKELQEWSDRLSLVLVVWTAEKLAANPIYLENKKRLLRYCCAPTPRFPQATHRVVMAALRSKRYVTIDGLLSMLPSVDADEAIAVVAAELREGRCHSDIEHYDLDYATTLSVHHEVGKR
ncbi:MAG: hypothetical protein U1F54_17970 [Burkholderiales bacterium]